jgi:hypothetical protein
MTEHVRHPGCTTSDPASRLEGVTRQQSRDLSHKALARSSESECWFAIWDILFDGQPRPASPYMDMEISAELYTYREVLANRGPAVLREELDRAGILLPMAEDQDSLLCLVWARLVDVIDQESSTAPVVLVGEHPRSLSPNPSALPSGDSGVGLASNASGSGSGDADDNPAPSLPVPEGPIDLIYHEQDEFYYDGDIDWAGLTEQGMD